MLQHTLNEVMVNVPYDATTTTTVTMDGGPLNIDMTFGSGASHIYLISATAYCYTASGYA